LFFQLQKYNLASFYKKTPEDIIDFVETYSKKKCEARTALIQAMDTRSSASSLDNLRNKHEKASCGSLLPKVIALEICEA